LYVFLGNIIFKIHDGNLKFCLKVSYFFSYFRYTFFIVLYPLGVTVSLYFIEDLYNLPLIFTCVNIYYLLRPHL
jgi:hypothetical protein